MGQTSFGLGTGGPDTTPLTPAGQKIAQAAGDFYQQALTTINNSKSDTYRQVIIGTSDDVLIAHTVLQGVEKLTLEELSKGQDVFFRYYRLSPPSPMMPSGFAVVRILRNPAGEWRAQLRNMRGELITELPASVEQQTNVGRISLTLGISADIDYGVVLPQGLAVALRYPDKDRHTKPY